MAWINHSTFSAHRLRAPAVLLLALLLAGCSVQDWIDTFSLDTLVTFFTAGPVAAYERNVMLFTFTVMLFVLVPVIGFTLWFAWYYRASNREASYTPNWHQSHLLEGFLWGGPIVIIIILGALTIFTTYDLDPYKPIESDRPTLHVEAISTDWNWLFIYPDYNVASVNEMAMPVDRPVEINLTSASVMTGFMIPRLGSQILVMSGMRTQLNLMASKPGTYFGKNYQYSGDGFAKMTFEAIATSPDGFKAWLDKARSAGEPLDLPAYKQLAKPSENMPVKYYSAVKPQLFQYVISQFNGGPEPGFDSPDNDALSAR